MIQAVTKRTISHDEISDRIPVISETMKQLPRPQELARRFWSTIRYYSKGLYHRVAQDHAFLLSGGLAFSLFVCAVPFALVLLAGLGMLFARPDVTAEIYAAIDRIIPYPEYAARIRDFVAARLVQMSSISEVAGVAGVIGLNIVGNAH